MVIQLTVFVVVFIIVLYEQFYLTFLQRHINHISINLSLRISKKFL